MSEFDKNAAEKNKWLIDLVALMSQWDVLKFKLKKLKNKENTICWLKQKM